MKDTKKILICENEEILLTALKFRLQKQGYELFLTADGAEAEVILKREKPDMLITDINVPQKNGLELINFIREDLEWDIPIVLIAPMEEGEAILKAKSAGATDFVTKPFKPVELVLRIRCIFQSLEY
ncbi:MAG: response regulator [Phaeodactylibacter sp.]|nr:response regulator [Phaeodactylibacter sp.]